MAAIPPGPMPGIEDIDIVDIGMYEFDPEADECPVFMSPQFG